MMTVMVVMIKSVYLLLHMTCSFLSTKKWDLHSSQDVDSVVTKRVSENAKVVKDKSVNDKRLSAIEKAILIYGKLKPWTSLHI